MVVLRQQLTSRLLCVGVGVSGVVDYKNGRVRDLALPTSGEPLNPTVGREINLSLLRSDEGRSTLTGEPVIGRVPVISASGKPLTPCKPSKARRLLAKWLAEKHWNELGQFYLRLSFKPKSELNKDQQLCLAVDTGSKWDGVAVLSKKGVLTSAMLVLPSKIAEKLEQRRAMRRARRYRKTPRRAKRFDNRHRPEGWIAPSQKAKLDFRIKVADELCKLYPVGQFAVEDVRFNHYKKRWGKHFSTVEIGKTKFYQHLKEFGKLSLYDGVETAKYREQLGLQKNPAKRELSWDTHAVDAIAIGCAEMGCRSPYPPEFWVWKRLEYSKRQLHRFEPDRGGIRRRYGGSWSIPPFRKGDVVQYHGRLVRVGGFMDGRISLHTVSLRNRRITQSAELRDCVRLYNQQLFHMRETPQFVPTLSNGVSLGG